jgi:hypothetical protein
VAFLLVLMGGTAYADNIQNDLAASGPTTITLSGGTASTTMKYYVHEAGGCDVSPSNPATYRVNVSGSGVTTSPGQVTFTTCDGTLRQSVTLTATTAGAREVTLSRVSGPSLNETPAKFTLTVNAPSNTAPTVAVGGVTDGASYEFGAVPTPTCTVTDAEDANPTATPTVTPITGPLAAYGLGSRSATCSYTDGGGITRQAGATYAIVDTTRPVLNTPGDQVLEATGPGGAQATWKVTASDAVGLSAPASCSPGSGTTFPLGTTTIGCSATDVAGNTRSGTFTVTVRDTTGPSLVVGNDVTREATGPGGATATYGAATAIDLHDGALTPACTPASGSRFPIGNTTVTCSVADASGNAASGTLTVHVEDTTGPEIDVPADRTVEATSPAGAAVTFDPGSVDAVDGTRPVSCSPASGTTFGFGDTTVVCTATDTRDNTGIASFVVTVEDTVRPELTVPAGVTAEATGPQGAVVAYDVSATDAADDDVTVDCIPEAGYRFPLGRTEVNCTAVDDHGNTTQKAFEVAVVDTTAPAVAVPDDRTLEATGPGGASTTYDATATDAVDGEMPATCAPGSGSTFPVGPSTVTCSATDAAGNTGEKTFTVTVVDTTGPVIDVPEDRDVEADRPAGARPEFEATATDLVDGSTKVTCEPPSASLFGFGRTTVTCTSTDRAGNTSERSFAITVADTTAPVLVLPDDTTLEATGPAGATLAYDVTATDAADDEVDVDCTPASGATFPLGTTTVSCTATDDHANATPGSFGVTVVDTTAPALTVPDGVTAEATGPGGAAVTWATSADDLVDGAVAPSCTRASGGTFALGTTEVSCSATDRAGNVRTKTFRVTVRDTTAPTLDVPDPVTAEATGPAGAKVVYVVTTRDAVDDNVDLVCDPPSNTTFPLGTTTVTCTATDFSGNHRSKDFTVTVRDTAGPSLSLPASRSVQASSAAGATVTWVATATDAVSGATPVGCTPSSGSTFAPGTTTVSCTSTDGAGNTTTGSFTVTVTFGWNGFFAPVDNNGTVNVIKAGQSVPLKWNVPNGSGGWISSLAIVSSVKQTTVACQSGATADEIEAPTSGATSLRYDGTANQYVYNWQSPKTPVGSCYRLSVNLTDGSSRTALFRTK